MSVGMIAPAVPVANDIIYGEFYVYINYDTPLQTLLGVTSEGCKWAVERVTHQNNFMGSYGPTLDTNGIPLVRYDSLEARVTLEMFYLNKFNKKTISTCESTEDWESGDWSNTGGTYAANTTNVNTGEQAAGFTVDTEGHGIHYVFDSDLDLTALDNAEVSGGTDLIKFAIYLAAQEKTDIGGTATLRLAFHCDVEETETNYFYIDMLASVFTADDYTILSYAKSAFSEEGSPDWSAIKGVALTVETAAPSAEVVGAIDSIYLVQASTASSIVPVNGHGFTYTDEGTYKKYIPDLEIVDEDYLFNLTLINHRHDGKTNEIILKNALNDGAISLALQSKSEVVNSSQFTASYSKSNPTDVPFSIREYTTAYV